MSYSVVQVIRVGRRNRLIVRGVVLDVPAGTSVDEVQDALTNAGLAPREHGIEWANHQVRLTAKLPPTTEQADKVDHHTWKQLTNPKPRQLNIRVPPRLYSQCETAAAKAGTTIGPWVEHTLRHAIAAQTTPH